MDTQAQEKAAECAREARKQAALLAPGRVRDALLEKVKQYKAEIPDEVTHLRTKLHGSKNLYADSGDCGQGFRLNATMQSDRRRPPVPTNAAGVSLPA